MTNQRVTVRVPATTGNLGPGFDCLGMALELWNEVTMNVSSAPEVRIRGEGASSLSTGENNLVYSAAQSLFHEAGQAPSPLSILCHNRIPLTRGLGSSAAAIVGGIVAANELCSQPLDQHRILQLATRLEGHADNVAPALLGGCQVVVRENDGITAADVPIPSDLLAVVFVPNVTMSTREARAILPGMVSREDVVYNLGRVALLVNALSTGRFENLKTATQDRLHQPAREKMFPAMPHIFHAALGAGALGVFLSGGGPTILALATFEAEAIGHAMANAASKLGVQGNSKVMKPSSLGTHAVTEER